ncbi:MAG: hypothetical protein NDJ90_12080 [Oligoflexia bacterium]|nr:hypothetical protein [Oligoflexia bacterium]
MHALSKCARGLRGRINGTPRSAVRATIFLLLSLILGYQAYRIAEAEAVGEWEARNPPSLAVWEYSLGLRGYHAPKDARQVHRVLATLPSTLDQPGGSWMSPDGSWVALAPQNEASSFQLFCRVCELPAEDWQPMNKGWRAFENVHARISAIAPKSQQKPLITKKKVFHDPREIRY